MSKMDKLKEIIRELIKKELEEASTSAATPGYQTPYAFSGGRKKDKKKKKKIATNSTGYSKVNEGRYHQYRNDESMTPKQKIGRSMREIRDSLNNLDKLVKMNVRLKNELNVDSRSYWKNTHKALNKISERLVKLANKVGQLQQSNTMPFEDNKKSYMDTLFSIATLLKRWQVEIQNKDIDKNYMLRRLNQWIEQLESLKHEIMMGRDK